MGLFKSLGKLTEDVLEIATTPIEIAADVTRAATKPLAEAAKEIKDGVKEELLDEKD